MKTSKWLKGALALFILLGTGASLKADDDIVNVFFPDVRPTAQFSRVDSDASPREKAEEFWREVGRKSDGDEEAAPVGKRYLVCFLATTHYDYKKESAYPEPLKDEIVGSYCLASLALIVSGFDDMITISGEYFNKKQIDAVFDILAQKTQANDEIFIYWNGHGGQLAGVDENGNIVSRGDCAPKDEADGIDEYLALYETGGAPCRSLDDFRNYAMVDDDLAKNFKKLDGRRVTAFFEVCHAAGMADPEQIEVTSRGGDGSRNPLGDAAPSFPCCTTWQELKSHADSTAELLSVWTAKNALSFDPVDDSWNQRGSGNLRRNDERQTSGSSNESATEASGLEMWEALRQGGAKSAKANGERASYDLSLDTVKEMAIAFTCLEAESSSAGLWDIQDGVLGRRVVNPGALALFAAISDARSAKRRLTFGDFRKILDGVITTHNDLEREMDRRYPNERTTPRGLQTPAYLSNANGLIIYDPERADANGGN